MSTDIRRLHAGRIRAERKARGWDKPEMARRLARAAGDTRGSLPDHDSLLTYVKRWERGTVGISERYRLLYCRAFDMAEEDLFASPQPILTEEPGTGDGLEVVEFIRRVEASDVGPSTMEGIQLGTHRLCREYPMKRPAELLPRICSYHHYVSRLLDGFATLAQRRELIVAGGTLSLLAACVHEDLGQRRAAELSGKTAQRAGMHTGHGELIAWAFEIRAWQALLDGRHRDAVEQCRAAC
jgi:transcriptional regulator with XRE-family HTH domain